MKDVESYAVSADSAEEFSGAINRVKKWIEELPETSKVAISIRAKVKDVAEQTELSKTQDMFKKGELKDGVHRKRKSNGKEND